MPQIKVPSILHGNKYEAVALKKFVEHMGKNTSKCGIHECADLPFLGGSSDALLVELDGSMSVAEVKCHTVPKIKPFLAKRCLIKKKEMEMSS